ncbi:Uncharacterised protein [Candidatus Ornithobacterium hominis]|uniref:Uncharacterized protein n=1 Tax=Candidatus Ornithobacterium hominis TaxID=2497989 RepID=A0A383U4J9_9FLAO|nr:hypothetical protein [Candidatus Ornithobacterium hominis]MCT7905192.1 hypothetical protein [Candidatus Ornithobacterium hominis]SZD74309.1 Uncharacterised protein [Candidatus Ornithobacterium hominis]
MYEREETYDFICFSELAYEWDLADKAVVESKIKRRINSLNVKYNQKRVNNIRSLRHELFEEISLGSKSKYFINAKGKFADIGDFNLDKMYIDYKERYTEIDNSDLVNIIEFAVYLFYVR